MAGELGAGITLVSETMKKEDRGLGTTVVASVGLFGAVIAGLTTIALNNWRMSYFIGGGLGLLLLFMRIGVFESGMFTKLPIFCIIRIYLFPSFLPDFFCKNLSISIAFTPSKIF